MRNEKSRNVKDFSAFRIGVMCGALNPNEETMLSLHHLRLSWCNFCEFVDVEFAMNPVLCFEQMLYCKDTPFLF